jgi:NitT/TauT family transport system permease protein
VILVFDQLLFRPLIASADWFRLEQEVGFTRARSWVLTMIRRSRLLTPGSRTAARVLSWGTGRPLKRARLPDEAGSRRGDFLWYGALTVAGLASLAKLLWFVMAGVPLAEVGHVMGLALLTLLRVMVLIAAASVVWVPLGVLIGIHPRVASIVQPIAQFLAAFPANLFFPIVVSGIVLWHLNPNIWLSPLMILGTQWYILFNVIVGASAIPNDLKYVGENLRLSGWLWWRKLALPAVFPFYVTGAITASGGSWNASVASEVASWGDQQLSAAGLGAYIARATAAGDFRRTVLGIVVMSLFVVILNRTFWRPLYARAERRFRLS